MMQFAAVNRWVNDTFSGTRQGIEDTVVTLTSQGVSLMAGLATAALIARGLGPVGMGEYALISSVSGLAALMSDLGIGGTAIRYAARAAARGDIGGQFAVLRWAFRLRLFFVFVTTAVLFAVIPNLADRAWHAGGLTSVMRLSLLIGICGALASIPAIYFQALKRFRTNSAVSVGQTLVLFAGILLIAWSGAWSLKLLVIVSIVATGAAAVAVQFLVPRSAIFDASEFAQLLKTRFKSAFRAPVEGPGHKDTIGMSRFAIYMGLSSILVQLTLRSDIWLMGVYLDKAQIGLYYVATKFTMPLGIVLGAVTTALWPRASALTSHRQVSTLLKRTFRLSAVAATLALIYSISAPYLATRVFGADYGGAVLLGQILCVRYCISILICPLGVIGYSLGLAPLYWLINALQLVIVVSVSVLLLPHIGALGAALSLVANEIVGFSLFGYLISRKSRLGMAQPENA